MGSARLSPRSSWDTPVTCAALPTAMRSLPTTEPHPSSFPRAAEWSTGSRQRGSRQLNHVSHMAAVTQIRTPGQTNASTSSARWPKERPRRKRCVHSSARSPTPSIGSYFSTLDRGSGRTLRDGSMPCVTGSSPCATGFPVRSLEMPNQTLRRCAFRVKARVVAPGVHEIRVLTQRGFELSHLPGVGGHF